MPSKLYNQIPLSTLFRCSSIWWFVILNQLIYSLCNTFPSRSIPHLMYSISNDLIFLNYKIIVPDKTNFFFNTWVISILKHEEKSKNFIPILYILCKSDYCKEEYQNKDKINNFFNFQSYFLYFYHIRRKIKHVSFCFRSIIYISVCNKNDVSNWKQLFLSSFYKYHA
jgi:hypothetical protein